MINLKTKKRKIVSGKYKGEEAFILVKQHTSSKLTIEDMAKYIMNQSSLHSSDVQAVLTCVTEFVAKAFNLGQSVELGELGTLYMQLSSPYKRNPKDLKITDVRKKIKFKPKKIVKEAIDNIVFRIDHTKE